MHIGGGGGVRGPAADPRGAASRGSRRKLPLVPRYRQRVRFLPLDVGRPVWVDDEHFNLAYHVRRTALPAPGGRAELRRRWSAA